jgi:hypothetical protein
MILNMRVLDDARVFASTGAAYYIIMLIPMFLVKDLVLCDGIL